MDSENSRSSRIRSIESVYKDFRKPFIQISYQRTVVIKLLGGFQVVRGAVRISGQKLTFVLAVRIRENGHVKRKTATFSQAVERTIQGVVHSLDSYR